MILEVYNVLPAAVRCYWTVKAILAGKHVLSETPSVARCSGWRGALAMQTVLLFPQLMTMMTTIQDHLLMSTCDDTLEV